MTRNTGIRLSTKMTIVAASLVIITLLISIFITLYFGNQMANESINKKLDSSQLIQQEFSTQKLRQLELVSLLMASDPAFVAYVAQTIFDLESGEQPDVASISDLLLERKQQYGFDLAVIATADGQQLARSDQAMAAPRDLQDMDLMAKVMVELLPTSGYWLDKERIYQAAIVPLARGRNLIGFLITGVVVDNSLTDTVANLTGTEVLVIANENPLRALASTLDLDLTSTMLDKLSNRDLTSAALAKLSINNLNLAIKQQPLTEIDGIKYVLVNGVSVDQVIAPFAQTRNLILMAGGVIIVFGLLMARLLVNQSLSPLEKISQATRQVSFGNYSASFPKKVGRDLADLSGSINQLIQNLRGRDSLAAHMVEMSKKSDDVIKRHQSPQKELIKPGKVINNRFEVIKSLGVGGMGAVFQAFDKELEEVVALKVLKTKKAEESEINLLKDEIKVARRISHPNVVRIHDFGQLANNVFISMEYVQGYTIEQILKYARKLRPQAAKHAAMHICEGLNAAHKAGVIHKDLKPANIIVELDSSIKLMDFGIASVDHMISGQRSDEMVSGTAAYISPEQALGKGSDERTDIYALGVLMMELFIGQRPFYAATEEDLMMKHVNEKPLAISSQWADAPKRLDQLILKCLAKSPNDRPQSIQEVISELKQISFSG